MPKFSIWFLGSSRKFFHKNTLFRRPKILLRMVFVVWQSNRTNFLKINYSLWIYLRNAFLIIYLIFAKVLKLFNFLRTMIEFIVTFFQNNGDQIVCCTVFKSLVFTLLFSTVYLPEKNWNRRNIILWCLKLNIIWIRYMFFKAWNLSYSYFF